MITEDLERVIKNLEIARINAYKLLAYDLSKQDYPVSPRSSLTKNAVKFTLDDSTHFIIYPDLPPLKGTMQKSESWYRRTIRDHIVQSIVHARDVNFIPFELSTILFVYHLPKKHTWPDPDNLEKKALLDGLRFAGFIRDDRLGTIMTIDTAQEFHEPYTSIFIFPMEKTASFMTDFSSKIKQSNRHYLEMFPSSNLDADKNQNNCQPSKENDLNVENLFF